MSRREEYEKQTEELLEPIVAEQGFELVDVCLLYTSRNIQNLMKNQMKYAKIMS